MYERLGFHFLEEWHLEENPNSTKFYCMARAPLFGNFHKHLIIEETAA